MKNIFYLSMMAFLCLMTSCSKADLLVGTWQVEDATAQIKNGQLIRPEKSDLGVIVFSSEGSFVQDGYFVISYDSYGIPFSKDKFYGSWEYNDKYDQVRMFGTPWKVTFYSDFDIELSNIIEKNAEIIEIHYRLSKIND